MKNNIIILFQASLRHRMPSPDQGKVFTKKSPVIYQVSQGHNLSEIFKEKNWHFPCTTCLNYSLHPTTRWPADAKKPTIKMYTIKRTRTLMRAVQYLYTRNPNCQGGEWKKWAISRNVICIFKVKFPNPAVKFCRGDTYYTKPLQTSFSAVVCGRWRESCSTL